MELREIVDADVALLAGSAARGEATPTSDLDLVVLFDHLESAFRESFVFDDWPVDVFAQDPDTLESLFARGDVDEVIGVAEAVLEPDGGWLFDGYRNVASAEWRGVPPE